MSVVPVLSLPSEGPHIKKKGHTVNEAFIDDTKKRHAASSGRVYKLFSAFCDNTSLHGLGEVVGSKSHLMKCVWAVAFVAAVAGNAYHLSTLIQTYLSYPKQQVTTTEEKSIAFPGVSICNLDAFSKSNTAQVRTSPETALYKLNNRLANVVQNGVLTTTDVLTFQSPMTMLENIGTDESRLVGHGLDDFVMGCTFYGRTCDIRKDFTYFLNAVMFNCYTFKPGNRTDNFSSVGQEYGLNLLLYLEVTNGTKSKAVYDSFTSIGNSIGARVTIHPQGSSPLPHYCGLDIMPGHSTSISYKPQHIFRLGEPYGKCRVDGLNEQSGRPRYDSLVCLGECRQKTIMDACKCKTSYEPAINESRYDEYPYCLKIPEGEDAESLKVRSNRGKCL
jgi:hypothetical protein